MEKEKFFESNREKIIKPVYRSNRQRLMVILISMFFMIRKIALLEGVHFLTIPRGKSVDMFPENISGA